MITPELPHDVGHQAGVDSAKLVPIKLGAEMLFYGGAHTYGGK